MVIIIIGIIIVVESSLSPDVKDDKHGHTSILGIIMLVIS